MYFTDYFTDFKYIVNAKMPWGLLLTSLNK